MDSMNKRISRTHPMHLVMLADDGASMAGERARDVTIAIRAWLSALSDAAAGRSRARFYCSLILFGERAETVIANVDACGIEPSDFMVPGGRGLSVLGPAMDAARGVLLADGATERYCPPLVIVCTDGPRGAPGEALAAAHALKVLPLPCGSPSVVAFGLRGADDGLLRRVASAPPLYVESWKERGIAALLPDVGTPRTRGPGQTYGAFMARMAGRTEPWEGDAVGW